MFVFSCGAAVFLILLIFVYSPSLPICLLSISFWPGCPKMFSHFLKSATKTWQITNFTLSTPISHLHWISTHVHFWRVSLGICTLLLGKKKLHPTVQPCSKINKILLLLEKKKPHPTMFRSFKRTSDQIKLKETL